MTADDELQALLLKMPDLSIEEQKMLLQQQQAQQLRAQGSQPSARRDFGSQGARALQGVGAAIGSYNNQTALDSLRQDKNNMQIEMMRILGQRNKRPDVPSLGVPTDRGVDNTVQQPDLSY